jgi:hypothetical protein
MGEACLITGERREWETLVGRMEEERRNFIMKKCTDSRREKEREKIMKEG